MKGLVALLAAGTLANLAVAWARAPALEGAAASTIEVPSLAPAWAIDEAESCKVVVVVQNSCPFCQQAATKASDSGTLVDRSMWVATGLAEADSFRVAHPDLTVVQEPSAAAELAVQGFPAAFLVRGDSIVATWGLRGDETPEYLEARGCALDTLGILAEQ